MSDEQRDALARIIDPVGWSLYDDPRVVNRGGKMQEDCVKSSRKTAQDIIESGLMAAYEWEREEYFRARDRIMECTSKTGKCYSVEDGLDGYFKHDPKCHRWPDGAIGGSGCIK